MPKQRCDIHQIFIGKNGCKICNEIKAFKEIESLKNDLIFAENVKESGNRLIGELHKENEILKTKITKLESESSTFNNQLNFENDMLRVELKREKEHIQFLESKELSYEVKQAIKHLTRNEKQLMINLLGGQSMLASVVDSYVKIPLDKQAKLKPIYDFIIGLAEQIDIFNEASADKWAEVLGVKRYSDTVNDVACTNDFMGGKISKCHTCTAWLDQKSLNKRIIQQELAKRG